MAQRALQLVEAAIRAPENLRKARNFGAAMLPGGVETIATLLDQVSAVAPVRIGVIALVGIGRAGKSTFCNLVANIGSGSETLQEVFPTSAETEPHTAGIYGTIFAYRPVPGQQEGGSTPTHLLVLDCAGSGNGEDYPVMDALLGICRAMATSIVVFNAMDGQIIQIGRMSMAGLLVTGTRQGAPLPHGHMPVLEAVINKAMGNAPRDPTADFEARVRQLRDPLTERFVLTQHKYKTEPGPGSQRSHHVHYIRAVTIPGRDPDAGWFGLRLDDPLLGQATDSVRAMLSRCAAATDCHGWSRADCGRVEGPLPGCSPSEQGAAG